MALSLEQNPETCYPKDIFEHGSNGGSWWVAHTKSRREKALAYCLASKGIGYYLPLLRKRQPNINRDRFALIPLFSGYLFFRGSAQERYLAFTSNHVARVIEVKDQKKLTDELCRIRKVLSIQMPVYPYDFLAEGQRVRVRHGPMKGLEGIISRKKGNYRLVLTVTTISQAVAVDVEAEMVEAV